MKLLTNREHKDCALSDDEPARKVPVIRFAYNIRMTIEGHYLVAIDRVHKCEMSLETPIVTVGLIDDLGVDTGRVHAAQYDVITVPEDFIVDYGTDGLLHLFDGDNNLCSISCNDMSTDEFSVCSADASFKTHAIKGLSRTCSSRDDDGSYHWIPLGIDKAADGGYLIATNFYPRDCSATSIDPKASAEQARQAALSSKINSLPLCRSDCRYV